MDALLSAGGRGTRLAAVTGDVIPKPMAKICGKPIIERAVISLKENGVDRIFVSVGHLADKIKEFLGTGEKWGVKIEYITETEPLGSGGALYYLKGRVKGDFAVCSGDTVFDIDVKRMLAYHKKKRAAATLFTHPNSHPYDSDLIKTDRFNRVTGIDLKNSERGYYYKNNVNAGFFIISPAALDWFTAPAKVNMEHDFIAGLVARGDRVYSYKSPEYIKDAGTPERFSKAEGDIAAGIVSARNLKNRQKAVFLDRDGTLNVYKGFISKAADIELVPGAAQAVKIINDSGYLAVIVSNQPVIARGEATFSEVNRQFDKIETLLGAEGAYIDGIYYCPHHPHSGFKGEVKRLKRECGCRKPKTGLLERAAKDFNLDLSECRIIGDSELDVKTGKNAGIPQILVKSGLWRECGEHPSFTAENLTEAAKKAVGIL